MRRFYSCLVCRENLTNAALDNSAEASFVRNKHTPKPHWKFVCSEREHVSYLFGEIFSGKHDDGLKKGVYLVQKTV